MDACQVQALSPRDCLSCHFPSSSWEGRGGGETGDSSEHHRKAPQVRKGCTPRLTGQPAGKARRCQSWGHVGISVNVILALSAEQVTFMTY